MTAFINGVAQGDACQGGLFVNGANILCTGGGVPTSPAELAAAEDPAAALIAAMDYPVLPSALVVAPSLSELGGAFTLTNTGVTVVPDSRFGGANTFLFDADTDVLQANSNGGADDFGAGDCTWLFMLGLNNQSGNHIMQRRPVAAGWELRNGSDGSVRFHTYGSNGSSDSTPTDPGTVNTVDPITMLVSRQAGVQLTVTTAASISSGNDTAKDTLSGGVVKIGEKSFGKAERMNFFLWACWPGVADITDVHRTALAIQLGLEG